MTWAETMRKNAAIAGLVCLGGGIAGIALAGVDQFFRSYLIGFCFWIGIPFGCLGIQMIHALTGGRWGTPVRRILYASSTTLPLFVLLFVPFFLGMKALYPWARPEALHDELIQHKAAYLNVPFFFARGFASIALWCGIAFWLYRRSLKRIRNGGPPNRRMRMIAGPGLLVGAITMSICAIDWLMSLDPHWFSTMFGVIYIVGQLLSAMCFVILLLIITHTQAGEEVPIDALHDLGNLLLLFVMLWAYVSFSQYLIIYAGNMAEDAPWYVHRSEGGWQNLSLALIVLHFAVPFMILVSRRSKRSPQVLGILAAFLLLMRLVEVFWLAAPNFYTHHFTAHWMDAVVPLGVGGIWVAAFFHRLADKELAPA